MKSIIFLILLLSSACFAESNNIETNSKSSLQHLDNLDTKISIIGINSDGHSEYIIPTIIDYDPISRYIQTHPKEFKQDHAKCILKLFHKNVLYSYRQIGHPSLHFTKQKGNYIWEIDIDKWRGSPTAPIALFKHTIFEVLPHLIFHTSTSQNIIAKLIAKKYRKSN